MINKDMCKGDIIVYETNGRRIYGVIVTNNNLNYNQDQVGVVCITTQPVGSGITYVDIMTNQPATVICEKVWNVWKNDIVEFIRECTTEEMSYIDNALRYVFGLIETKRKTDITDMAAALQEYGDLSVKEHIAKLKADNKALSEITEALKGENASLKVKCVDLAKKVEAQETEIEHLKHLLDKANEDSACWLEKAAESEPEIAALTAERDTYKALYEKLLDKLIGA